MTVRHLTETVPAWVEATQETAEPIVSRQCTALRNLSDFVFPEHCSDDERRAIESRIVRALKQCPAIPDGHYYSVSDMNGTALRLLAERRLITYDLLYAQGPRGVYISDDQCLAVMVNAMDHVTIRATVSDGDFDSTWALVDRVDEALGGLLNFTFHERLGYLTSALRTVGTGLKLCALLHLPALAMSGRMHEMETRVTDKRLLLRGIGLGDPRCADSATSIAPALCSLTPDMESVSAQSFFLDVLGDLSAPVTHSAGNLFLLSNQDTLGLSERELIIHVEQALSDLVQQEEKTRQRLLREQRNALLDCFGRALGLARGARLLNLREAYQYASLIRLADAMRLIAGCDRVALGRALLECQQAHLQLMRDVPMEASGMCAERARIFRSLFTGTDIN